MTDPILMHLQPHTTYDERLYGAAVWHTDHTDGEDWYLAVVQTDPYRVYSIEMPERPLGTTGRPARFTVHLGVMPATLRDAGPPVPHDRLPDGVREVVAEFAGNPAATIRHRRFANNVDPTVVEALDAWQDKVVAQ